jgi:hypothetical protein
LVSAVRSSNPVFRWRGCALVARNPQFPSRIPDDRDRRSEPDADHDSELMSITVFEVMSIKIGDVSERRSVDQAAEIRGRVCACWRTGNGLELGRDFRFEAVNPSKREAMSRCTSTNRSAVEPGHAFRPLPDRADICDVVPKTKIAGGSPNRIRTYNLLVNSARPEGGPCPPRFSLRLAHNRRRIVKPGRL